MRKPGAVVLVIALDGNEVSDANGTVRVLKIGIEACKPQSKQVCGRAW